MSSTGSRTPVRILTLGTGQMGAGIVRAILETPGLELAGAWARRRERAGQDVGAAVGLGRAVGVAIGSDLERLVAETRPQVAIQATCSLLCEAVRELEPLLEAGVHVVSIAEELAWPWAASPEEAERLDRLARRSGAALLGTGVNPGFVFDLLPVVLSGVCTRVERIEARRVNDLSPYGPTVLDSQGVGLTPEAFLRGIEAGSVVGHFGFPQSMGMIAGALGWEIERIEERREPIVSTVERETPCVRVRPGQVAGCHHSAVAYVGGRPAISLDHPQQIRPELEGVATGDEIEIHGSPGVRLAGSPEIPGGAATIALAVNCVPRVIAAAPGLRSMIDLPVPVALRSAARAAILDAEPSRGRMTDRVGIDPIGPGAWVEVEQVVLEPGARAPQVPDDTQATPLLLRVHGRLVEAGQMGEEVEIETRTGRRLRGRLVDPNPCYRHGFGAPVPELSAAADAARAILAAGREDTPP